MATPSRVPATLGLPVDECVTHLTESEGMQSYRNFLFMRIVPIVKDDVVPMAIADLLKEKTREWAARLGAPTLL